MDVRRHRPPLLLAALAAVVVAVFVLVGADPAAAHDTLRSSNPGDEEHLATAPDQVVLRFGGHPLEMGATIVVAEGANR